MDTATKECKVCQRTLPATTEHFHQDRSHSDGLRSQCRDCRSKKDAQRRELNRVKREELSDKAVAHRNAILRLISNHRSEFDALVKAERVAKSQQGVWISAV